MIKKIGEKKYIFQGFLKKFQPWNSSIFEDYLEARIIESFEVDSRQGQIKIFEDQMSLSLENNVNP